MRYQFSLRKLLIAVAALAALAAVVSAFANRKLARRDLDRLLAGDDKNFLKRLRIEFQQRVVDCSDPIVTEYLSKMMRASAPSRNGARYSYFFTFHFSSGRTYSHYGYVGPNQFSLSVPNAKLDEPAFPTHHVVLQSPVPKEVDTIFAFLVAPWEDVGGLELHLRGNQEIRYSYVPALHGGNPRGKRVDEYLRSNQ